MSPGIMSPGIALPALLAILLAPPPAHAGTIDDFTLVGDGNVITYSLPATATIPDHPHIVSLNATAPMIVNGISGSSELGTYFLPFLNPPDMTLLVPSSIDGGELTFYGPYLLSFYTIPSSDPMLSNPDNDDIVATFVPGTYSITEESFSAPSVNYTLTITPEAAPAALAATPEPGSLTLLATAALGLLGIASRRHSLPTRKFRRATTRH